MISHFFIDRPIFAAVLSIVIVLAGGVAISSLPLAQYPDITPPTVQVLCSYPGANAQVVADTVAAPIEQQVNGVEDMLYMSSQCTNDGAYTLTVTFRLGTDLQLALVQVQNRVQLAMPQLPNQVSQQGVNIKKRTPNILLVVNLISPDGRYDDLYLSNYATIRVRDELMRLPGVTDVIMLGERDYSIRAWFDPEQLATRSLTTAEVVSAVQTQNNQVVAGQLGQPPAARPHGFPAGPLRAGPVDHARRVRRHRRQDRRRARQPGDAGGPAPRRGPAWNSARSSTTNHARWTDGPRPAWPSSKTRRPTPWIRPTAFATKWRN